MSSGRILYSSEDGQTRLDLRLPDEATCKDYLQVRREQSREVTRKLRQQPTEAGGFPACSRWLRSNATTPPDTRPQMNRTPAGVQSTRNAP